MTLSQATTQRGRNTRGLDLESLGLLLKQLHDYRSRKYGELVESVYFPGVRVGVHAWTGHAPDGAVFRVVSTHGAEVLALVPVVELAFDADALAEDRISATLDQSRVWLAREVPRVVAAVELAKRQLLVKAAADEAAATAADTRTWWTGDPS
ncbi:hypothetical protein [Rhodococcus sp. JS3073]|uniref:hypothetical protein n=1 Tax=Rhodococcus sp. JS3073 TaxID=3002901 RepID=UPI002286BF31|nr:hypothetical protein [Rhodococcus sp. JS3073]WAM17516.1 hypothetical protein OYT95_13125 [Rhodococcus sp. JS3073]